MLLLEIIKARAKETVALTEIASAPIISADNSEAEGRIECLRECLQQLSAENRELIIQYYQGEKAVKIQNRKQLIERLGIPINTLRMRALRLRQTLQACVENCLKK
jgi:DNA-directed RNA polymerase specialized sigma24 family protein